MTFALAIGAVVDHFKGGLDFMNPDTKMAGILRVFQEGRGGLSKLDRVISGFSA
jgi:hypothetical protein